MIAITHTIERWQLLEPFEIAGKTYTEQPVVLVTVRDAEGHIGRGEAAGVDYDGETPESIVGQIVGVENRLRSNPSSEVLLNLLPKGGARNAVDCALWDLRAKRSGVPAWRSAGLDGLDPLTTTLTLGLCEESDLRRKARSARHFPLLKLKVDAHRHLDVVRIVREEHPSARILIDANQAWSRGLLDKLLPPMAAMGVELIEQPLPQEDDAALDGITPNIPLAADESCRDRQSLQKLAGRYQYVNIKLDKCGGLTEGLAMAHEARRLGLGLMVGNMCGTSLAMAPSFLLALLCRYVDLDGPLLQCEDRETPMRYDRGIVSPPLSALWG